MNMRRVCLALATVLLIAGSAAAQKAGGELRVYAEDSPASMSIHEEATPVVVQFAAVRSGIYPGIEFTSWASSTTW
jgi:hypothetical protein